MQKLRYPLAAAYLFLLALPVFVFLSSRQGSLSGLDAKSLALVMFPLFGLIAFTLVSMQLLIGPNIRWLRKIFPKIYIFHRVQGIFAFLFALIHPAVLLLAVGFISAVWTKDVVSAPLRVYVLFGQAALLTLCVTVPTAFAAWKLNTFNTSWRFLHYMNYLVFIFAWIHSWFIGSDIRTTSLKYVWLFYLAAGVATLLIRIFSPGTIGRAPAAVTPPESTPSA